MPLDSVKNILTTPTLDLEIRIALGVSFDSITLLILWLARFFNRRIHECVQLKEEYVHKVLVLLSYKPYSARLEGMNQKLHEEFISSVTKIITHNPASSISRKKGDHDPIEDITKLAHAVNELKDINTKTKL